MIHGRIEEFDRLLDAKPATGDACDQALTFSSLQCERFLFQNVGLKRDAHGVRRDIIAVVSGTGFLVLAECIIKISPGDVIFCQNGGFDRLGFTACELLHASDKGSAPDKAEVSSICVMHHPVIEAKVALFLLEAAFSGSAGEFGDARVLATAKAALEIASAWSRLRRTARLAARLSSFERFFRVVDQAIRAKSFGPMSIARHLGVSRASLYRMLKDCGGIEAFVRGRRLDLCVEAFFEDRHPPVSIKQIASEMGFSTQPHFSRAFRGRFAMSPTEARQFAQAARTDRTKLLAAETDIEALQYQLLGADRRDMGQRCNVQG